MEGYREKRFGLILNGWKPEETVAVRDLVFQYSDDCHEELLAGPDEIFIHLIFGNLRGTPDEHFGRYLLGLEKALTASGFGHVCVSYEPMMVSL